MTTSPCLVTPPRVTVNPSGHAPLTAVLVAVTRLPTSVSIDIDDGYRQWGIRCADAATYLHEVTLLNLRAGRTHRVVLGVHDGDERVDEATLEFTTDALPDRFPAITVLHAEPARMEPGYTVFPCRPSEQSQGFGDFGAIVAVDASGEVVWFYQTGHVVDAPRRLRNGHFLYIGPNQTIFEIDMMGRTVARWQAVAGLDRRDLDAVPVAARQFHHDVFEMPNGNLLAACVEVRSFEDYPTREADPLAPRETSKVVGDVIVEFTRAGKVVNRWPLLDLIDPWRFGYGGLQKGNPRRADVEARNWSHCNSVFYDETSDSILLSVRMQDAILKISRSTGRLDWILGTHDNWRSPWSGKLLRPLGSLEWPFHQHDATFTSRRTVLCFDNGNHRASPPATKMPPELCYSRAVEYEVDGTNGTVRQVWEYGKDREDRLFSVYVGGARRLTATGNVLIDFGGIVRNASGAYQENPGGGVGEARVVEVTGEAAPEVVFELAIARQSESGGGWDAYRAARVQDLFNEGSTPK